MCRPLNASCFPVSSHLPDAATNSTTFGETPVRSVSSGFFSGRGKGHAQQAKPVTYWWHAGDENKFMNGGEKETLFCVF